MKTAFELYEGNVAGPVASNHGNLYVTLLALCLGRYGVSYANQNGKE